MVILRVVLAALLSALAWPASAQSPLEGPRPEAAVSETSVTSGAGEAEEVLDVNKIDPETFQAIAGRLPEGQAPRIDGRLDDEVWSLAVAAGNFVQREPRVGARATERTEFRILYDERKLYIGVWCYDSDAAGIRASELARDAGLRKGDQIKIVIDTFHDRRNAYYFSTNPIGAFKDAQTSDNGRMLNYDWNAVWENRTSIDDQGWYVEIAIPFSQLRFKGSPGETTWGLNVSRIVIRKNEESYWVPFPREWGPMGLSRMSHAGVLLGLRGIESRRRLEFMPFLAPLVARDYDAGTPAVAEAGYGLDLRVGLTSNLTADLTYKTDFAQVEADQEVVNLSRFSLFFPEKRQFFTESAGIFSFGRAGMGPGEGGGPGGPGGGPGLLPLFYSRRIGLQDGREVPILGGGKVTGRTGRYALGFMNIETEATRYRSGEAQIEVPRANYTVFRVKRSLFAQSSVGAILLNRAGGAGADYNRSAGLDAGLQLGRNVNVTGLLAKTFSPGASGRDWAGAFDFDWKSDRFNYGLTYLDIAERFNAEMGYIRRTDIRNTKMDAAWTPRPRWRGVRQVTLRAGTDYFENHAGRVESRNHGFDFSLQRQDSSHIRFNIDRDFDYLPAAWTVGPAVVPAGGYDWTTLRAGFNTNQSRRIYGGGGVDVGGYYSGDKQTVRGSFNFLPLDTLLVETSVTRNRITLPGAPVYVTNTISTRASYSFSPDLFVKSFVQYNDERRLASLNLLFWYIYRPGSDLYIVYNQGWETDVPGPRDLRVRSRSLAIKMTYWLAR